MLDSHMTSFLVSNAQLNGSVLFAESCHVFCGELERLVIIFVLIFLMQDTHTEIFYVAHLDTHIGFLLYHTAPFFHMFVPLNM